MSDSRERVRSLSSFLLRVCLNAPELATPVLGEHPAPVVNGAKRVCVRSIQRPPAVPTHRHKVHVQQHLQVLRHRGLLHLQGLRDLADRSLLGGNELQNVSTARLGHRVEWIRGRRRARHGLLYIFRYGNMSTFVELAFDWRSGVTPASFIAVTTSGCTRSPGCVPADTARAFSRFTSRLKNAAAICERPALCTHAIRTFS